MAQIFRSKPKNKKDETVTVNSTAQFELGERESELCVFTPSKFSYKKNLHIHLPHLVRHLEKISVDLNKIEKLIQTSQKKIAPNNRILGSIKIKKGEKKFHGLKNMKFCLKEYYLNELKINTAYLRDIEKNVNSVIYLRGRVLKVLKVLNTRISKNEKDFKKTHNILENAKKKQTKFAKESSKLYVAYLNLNKSIVGNLPTENGSNCSKEEPSKEERRKVDTQLLKEINSKLTKSIEVEKKMSKEYQDAFKETYNYHDDFINENRDIANEVEKIEFETCTLLRSTILKFIQAQREFHAKKLTVLNGLSEKIKNYKVVKNIEYFANEIELLRPSNVPLRHSYSPMIPYYLKSDTELKNIMQNLETSNYIKAQSSSQNFKVFLVNKLNLREYSGKIDKKKMLKLISKIEKRKIHGNNPKEYKPSVESIKFFENFLEKIFLKDFKQIDINDQQNAFKKLEKYVGRNSFTISVHQFRGHPQVKTKKGFHILESLIRFCFLKAFDTGDVNICNNLLIMIETFYICEEKSKSEEYEYMTFFLRGFSIFNSFKFWEEAYLDCLLNENLVNRERVKLQDKKWIKEKWIDTKKYPDKDLRQFVNRNFLILNSFSKMMKDLELSSQLIKKFITNCALSADQVQIIKGNLSIK